MDAFHCFEEKIHEELNFFFSLLEVKDGRRKLEGWMDGSDAFMMNRRENLSVDSSSSNPICEDVKTIPRRTTKCFISDTSVRPPLSSVRPRVQGSDPP